MVKRLCTFAGCNAVVEHTELGTSPRCPKHQREHKAADRGVYNHERTRTGGSVYHTQRWKRLRAAKLARNPLCEHCLARGRSVPTEEVDHIVELRDGGAMWDITNLQSLCKPCHNRKTLAEKKKRNAKKRQGFRSLSDFK